MRDAPSECVGVRSIGHSRKHSSRDFTKCTRPCARGEMGCEGKSGLPAVMPLYRQRRTTSRSGITGRVMFRRFCKPSGRECAGSEQRCGIVRAASPSACQLALVMSAMYMVLFITNVSSLTCHCKDAEACDPNNGFCKNGCATGWYGAGCQVGNMAYKTDNLQSTTSATETAVYGFKTTAIDMQTSILPWWFVYLSQGNMAYKTDGVMSTTTTATVNGADVSSISTLSTQTLPNISPRWFVTYSKVEDTVITNITILTNAGDTSLNSSITVVLIVGILSGLLLCAAVTTIVILVSRRKKGATKAKSVTKETQQLKNNGDSDHEPYATLMMETVGGEAKEYAKLVFSSEQRNHKMKNIEQHYVNL